MPNRRIDVNAVIDRIRLKKQGADPSTPSSGFSWLYNKSNGFYYMGDDGAANLISLPYLSDIYIDASGGNDTTGDGKVGSPYATLAKALSVLPDYLSTSVTIHCVDGTYTEAVVLKRFRCQGDVWLTITGNTTTPANVDFTGTDGGAVATVQGNVQIELEGLQLNATITTGLSVANGPLVYVDRCNITGSLTYGIVGTFHSTIRFWGNITIDSWSDMGITLQRGTVGVYNGPGTLTITGPGTSGIGIHIYAHAQLVFGGNPANLTITGVQFGFQMGLNALFQHITATGTITIDNASKPANSAAIQCTDLSSWSINQTVTIDNFTDAFEANSISYVEASGTRNITNVTNISDASQNSVIYLP